MRVALVHDWLVAQRGGENVLLALAERFPDAPIYTLVHEPGTVAPTIERHRIITSFVQRLPGDFRFFLPLFPRAVAAWDLSAYDLVLSTSHCVAKAARARFHVSYIHTPMRYLWDQLPSYVPDLPAKPAWVAAARVAATPLRLWDRATARRPDALIANSAFVAARIERVWKRRAPVVHPPVDVDFYAAAPERPRRGLLAVGALVPYKRMDLAVAAARLLGEPLTLAGDGPSRPSGDGIQHVGNLERQALREAYATHEALLFCGEEDFGIVPVEAIAAGCPVVAFGRGGALETVVEGTSGTFFHQPTADAVARAVDRVRRTRFDRGAMLVSVQRFRHDRFADRVMEQVAAAAFEKGLRLA